MQLSKTASSLLLLLRVYRGEVADGELHRALTVQLGHTLRYGRVELPCECQCNSLNVCQEERLLRNCDENHHPDA